ncbi:hypothetical protein LJR260_001368 [Variovorax paradoxus]|uniref:hypothetical protein n=1 Tax=Variovorax paradoxus TaxID=34073 RepID=UPI003ECF2E27
MNENTTPWNRLRELLDSMFGFAQRRRSIVKQGFDNAKQEHVVLIEYRAHVKPPGAMGSDGDRSEVIEADPTHADGIDS